MAENLLAYAFPREREETVSDIYRNIKSRLNAKDDDLKPLLKELQTVRAEVIKRENEFYHKLGINNYSELKGRMAEISDNYNFLLANNRIIWEVRKRYDFTKISQHASMEEIAAAVEDALNTLVEQNGRQMVNEALAKIEGGTLKGSHRDAFSEYVQKHLRLEDRQSTSRRFVTSRKGEKVGLGKLIIGYDARSGKPKIDTEGTIFSTGFIKKLESVLASLRKDQGNSINVYSISKEQFKKEIDELILQTAQGEARVVLQRVITQGNLTHQFDLNRSIASVTGYCGEIRAAAILLQVTGDLSTRGTGALRSDLTGAEIPIDIVCMANGFQIKNYTLNGKTVAFNNALSALSWVEGRLRLKGSLRDILVDLFGVYQYNQPFSSMGGELRADPAEIQKYRDEYYDKFYSENGGLFYEFKDIFDARVPTMLKMYEGFSVAGDEQFSLHQVYFNTFFWINKHLVPSSVILDGLIKQLRQKNSSMIETKYTIYEPKREFSLQKEPNLLKKSSMSAMAKKLKLEYDIEIELPKFV